MAHGANVRTDKTTGDAKTVAIIGAGIAGLSAGCYAQMSGYRAHIYEMHSKPGGLCTSWDRKGYTIDCCIDWLTGSRPGTSLYKLWREVGLIQGLEIIDLDEFTRVEFPNGPTIVFYTDLDRLEEHLVAMAPEDAPLLRRFLGDGRRLAKKELPSDLPPRELMRLGTTLRMMTKMVGFLRPMRKWNSLTIAQFVERFQNPYLREAFSQVWLPEMSAFILLMTLVWFHGRQAGYPIGGSLPWPGRWRNVPGPGREDRLRVQKVCTLVENDRAVGVVVDAARMFDVVVSRRRRCQRPRHAERGHVDDVNAVTQTSPSPGSEAWRTGSPMSRLAMGASIGPWRRAVDRKVENHQLLPLPDRQRRSDHGCVQHDLSLDVRRR